MVIHRDRRVTPLCVKSRPPLRGRLEKAAGGVARLRVALPCVCATLLASGLLQAITTVAGIGFGP